VAGREGKKRYLLENSVLLLSLWWTPRTSPNLHSRKAPYENVVKLYEESGGKWEKDILSSQLLLSSVIVSVDAVSRIKI
jgi:hypothetical protein